MTTKITAAQIETLRAEAACAGDYSTVRDCDRVLFGGRGAKAALCRIAMALCNANAQR